MKQILVLSGKGGTGKTTIASSLIEYINARAYSDCDVDAPNLHLVNLKYQTTEKDDFFGLKKAEINNDKCIDCGRCIRECKFDAIKYSGAISVNKSDCEGCGVCQYICPVGAISMKDYKSGEVSLSKDECRTFTSAQLEIGEGASGKLVTEVKKQLVLNGRNADIAVIDGPPGIGCPVVASVTGVDVVIIVAEPSLSGISDFNRIINTAKRFDVRIMVIINKYNININNTEKINEICLNEGITVLGKLPFDSRVSKCNSTGETILVLDGEIKREITNCFEKVIKLL